MPAQTMKHCSVLKFLRFRALEAKDHALSLNFTLFYVAILPPIFFFLFLFAYILLMLSGFFKHISDFIPLDFLLAFPRHSMSVPCLFFQILVLVASTTER